MNAEVVDIIVHNIIMPILVALAGYAVILLKKYLQRLVDSIELKNELESINQTNSIRSKLITEIANIVNTAVGSNMQWAEEMKATTIKLTDEQANTLKNAAKEAIMNALPEGLKTSDSKLMNIIGGEEILSKLIDNMIEKFVYDYKIQKLPKKDSNDNQS